MTYSFRDRHTLCVSGSVLCLRLCAVSKYVSSQYGAQRRIFPSQPLSLVLVVSLAQLVSLYPLQGIPVYLFSSCLMLCSVCSG